MGGRLVEEIEEMGRATKREREEEGQCEDGYGRGRGPKLKG